MAAVRIGAYLAALESTRYQVSEVVKQLESIFLNFKTALRKILFTLYSR